MSIKLVKYIREDKEVNENDELTTLASHRLINIFFIIILKSRESWCLMSTSPIYHHRQK
jgi:hypothetical protein